MAFFSYDHHPTNDLTRHLGSDLDDDGRATVDAGELIACDVTDLGSHSWHHTLALRTTKGDKPTVIALAPPTMQAIEGPSPTGVTDRWCATPPGIA